MHFWLTAVSGIGLLVGLFFLLAGNAAIEPLVAISSIGFYAAMFLFVFIALPAIWKRHQPAWRQRRATVPCGTANDIQRHLNLH